MREIIWARAHICIDLYDFLDKWYYSFMMLISVSARRDCIHEQSHGYNLMKYCSVFFAFKKDCYI